MLGPVFRAYEPEQGRLVAVKLFQLDLPPERVHRLVAELEALIATDVAHPGIAAPIAAGLNGVSAYLAQDFVTADSLDTIVRHGPVLVMDVSRVVSQLGGALAAAATQGVIHGALHPRDVLMSSDDVRMTGIGVAQALERAGLAAPVRRPYSAPERIADKAVDERADVYSLGALSYELLTGRRIPGPGELTSDMLGDLPGIDRQTVRRVISRALAESPDDRFETSIAFADALQEALGKRSKSATGRPASRPLPLEADVPPEPAPFAPLPVEELPLLTEEMLAPAAGDMLESVAAEANDTGADVDMPASPLVPAAPFPMTDPEDAEWPLDPRALPADDLPLAVGDAQPALSDIHLSESDDAAEDEIPLPASVAPHERSASIVIPRAAAEPPNPELARRPEVLAEARTDDEAPRLSGVRPLVLALVVGVAIGVPIGVFIAPERLTSRAAGRVTVPTTPAPAAIVEEPIREFTDRAAVREEPVAPPATQNSAVPSAVATAAPPPVASATAPGAATVPSSGVRSTASVPPPIVEPRPSAKTPTADRAASGTANVRRERPGASDAKAVMGKAGGPRPSSASQRPAAVVPPAAAAPPRARPAARAAASPSERASTAASSEPGSLLVDSRPPGANVFLDGRLVGTTPLVLSSVALGEHAIHLERAGYQRWASSVKIVAGARSRIAASLEYR